MCGIAGMWKFNNRINLDDLQRFTDSMAHRGPDGAGYQILENNSIGFGHRRLSILDLSERGKQPMSFLNERYWITFNGEIFNFLQLREELSQDYSFRSDSDTEVILAAFHKWGKACLKKFNGMWAFAIFDTERKTLFLSRDRFGVKPLHYIFARGEQFAFASETIAFQNLPDFKKQLNQRHLALAIDNNNVLEGLGHTVFENIFQLLPGHYIEISHNEEPKQLRWWDTLAEKVEVPEKYEEQVEEFKSLFEDACRLRLISDVPVATALSGGVDSSAVFCMITNLVNQGKTIRSHKNNKTAFCATFSGTEVDEKSYAQKVVEFTGGDARYIEPEYANLTKHVVESTRLFDSITATPLYSILGVYRGMKQNGFTVSLDGHGGDEILYGYTPTVFEVVMHAFETKNAELEKEAVETYLNMFPPETIVNNKKWLNSIKEQVNAGQSFVGKSKTLIKQIIGKETGRVQDFELRNPWINPVDLSAPHSLSNKPYNYSHLNRAERVLAKDFCLLNIPYNLRDFDRAAMQTGIEIRMPLMDYRLVQFCFSLPFSAKMGQGLTKLILRDAMKGLMPEEIRLRKNKMGFSAPVKKWLGTDMQEFVRDTATSRSFLEMPIIDKQKFEKEFNEAFAKPETDNGFYVKLWTLINAHLISVNN